VETFELLPSLAQGDLGETTIAELVAAVLRSRASGTLAIDTPGTGEIRAFFRAGDMCGTASFNGFRTLAHVLLATDRIDALQIESTQQAAAKAGKRHGEALVEQGLLTADQLRTVLGEQHRENLHVLLGLTEGKYEWRGWEPPPAWAREVTVDPVSCMVDALQTDALRARRARVIHWLSGEPVRLSADWPEMQGRVALDAPDRRAVALLAKPRKADEFVRASQLAPARGEALLVALLLCGCAEPGTGAASAEPVPEDAEVLDLAPLEPVPAEEIRPPTRPSRPVTRPVRAAPVDRDDEVEKRLDAAAGSDDEPLELDRDESAEERARELRMRMLKQGLRNLGIAPKVQGGEAVEEAPRPAAPTVEPEDPAIRAFVQEVQQRVAALDTQNAYVRLSVATTATTEQIKTAYIAAAKRFHPDRASSSPALVGILPDLQALFGALKEAHDDIGSPEARARYDHQLKQGGTGKVGSRREEASLSLKMGEVLLKKRDFEAALHKLRRAVDLDPNGETLAALAWGVVSDPKVTPAGREEAMSLINRAVRAAGATARTHYVAGVLWRTKDPESAAEEFRKALALDPKHSDASLELRLLETRQGKHGAKGKDKEGGVLSGLFGRRKP
jgi:curved DNA-binding protein CbpA